MQQQSLIVSSRDVRPLQVLGAEVRFLCDETRTGGAWSMMEVTLPRDAGPPPHTHPWDEAYYVLEGDVLFTVGEKCFTATAGDFVYTPRLMLHGFRGASQSPARVLILDAPAHAGAFFRRIDQEVRELPRDLPKMLQIGESTGIRFAPPASGSVRETEAAGAA
ncbi:MAG: cupin domain-containing protein [Pseudomonadota bacterium]|nr:cupin domain-containing protein [Pseudomonadota bacterium]